MAPAVVAALIQALITLGPGALQAITALINAAHGKSLSDADHVAIGKAVAEMMARQPVA